MSADDRRPALHRRRDQALRDAVRALLRGPLPARPGAHGVRRRPDRSRRTCGRRWPATSAWPGCWCPRTTAVPGPPPGRPPSCWRSSGRAVAPVPFLTSSVLATRAARPGAHRRRRRTAPGAGRRARPTRRTPRSRLSATARLRRVVHRPGAHVRVAGGRARPTCCSCPTGDGGLVRGAPRPRRDHAGASLDRPARSPTSTSLDAPRTPVVLPTAPTAVRPAPRHRAGAARLRAGRASPSGAWRPRWATSRSAGSSAAWSAAFQALKHRLADLWVRGRVGAGGRPLRRGDRRGGRRRPGRRHGGRAGVLRRGRPSTPPRSASSCTAASG